MLKSISAIMVAAAIAAAVTVLSAPAAQVDASPLAKPAEAAMKRLHQQPWPYLAASAPRSAIRTSGWSPPSARLISALPPRPAALGSHPGKIPEGRTMRRPLAAALLMWAAPAFAQSYPNRPIRIIVPTPAGGPVDVMARLSPAHCRRASGKTSSSRTSRAPAIRSARGRPPPPSRTAIR